MPGVHFCIIQNCAEIGKIKEADASKYEKLALEMDDSLAEQWRGASSLYSGFRIFGCTDL